MSRCECKPGTYSNGWLEKRCDDCLYDEMKSWRCLGEIARAFATKRRGGAA